MKVTYDARCLRFDGAPQFLLSGSIHYPRTHPSRWASLFASLRAAGLNAVETYVFWGEHQRTPAPDYDWSGRRDLWGFIAAAGDAGLVVLLRLGPYVCAEAHFGGLPAWLRALPGIRFRTDNRPFCDAMGDWCRVVASELRHRRLSAADGGPVVAVQLENEYEMVADAYGPGGGRYLEWVGRLGAELDVASPSPTRHLPTWHTAVVTAPAVSDGWFLDMGGLTRGALYVNGHHLARYWTVAGVRGLNGFLDGSPMGVGLATVAVTAGIEKDADGHGSPGGGAPAPPSTQRYYHVPPWVVTDSDAARVTLHVTILDEGGARPDTVALYDSAMEAVEGGHGTSAFAPRGCD
ncbi:hypothetical protein I4F81_005241 [Pyropia yezoensis]|uniref:Uncharacterized protein n=1 Tax=Pyropia yezoensis TaxID=2788 RepID=A0ACC3BXT9_PYRYE|nr:hypothetical protein I4F81_005241 [Neopyropia yezoensis]